MAIRLDERAVKSAPAPSMAPSTSRLPYWDDEATGFNYRINGTERRITIRLVS